MLKTPIPTSITRFAENGGAIKKKKDKVGAGQAVKRPNSLLCAIDRRRKTWDAEGMPASPRRTTNERRLRSWSMSPPARTVSPDGLLPIKATAAPSELSRLTEESSLNGSIKKDCKKPSSQRRSRSWTIPPVRLGSPVCGLLPIKAAAASSDQSKLSDQCNSDGAATKQEETVEEDSSRNESSEPDIDAKNVPLPRCVMAKISRILSVKKRDFARLRKHFMSQQNMFLEHYAQLREIEARAGIDSDAIASNVVKVVTLNGWPASDILLLLEDGAPNKVSDVSSVCGLHLLNTATKEMDDITCELTKLFADLMGRRTDFIKNIRSKNHLEKSFGSNVSRNQQSFTKVKCQQYEEETKELNELIGKTVEHVKEKHEKLLQLMRVPWINWDKLNKKIEKLQKENLILQNKIESLLYVPGKECKDTVVETPDQKAETDDLVKERTARETLRELVFAAEGMLRSARSRITAMEQQSKEIKAELENTKKKHKEMELLYRQREVNYEIRSKKLIEISKSGDQTIETLSRQRDALEIRVKDLLSQLEKAEQELRAAEADNRSRISSLQAKLAEQEKQRLSAEARVKDLERQNKELDERFDTLKHRSNILMDIDRHRYLGLMERKEVTPGDREIELYKELQATRAALSRTQEEYRKAKAEKDEFLSSLTRIANTENDSDEMQEQIATELIKKEKEIDKLHAIIQEHKENEKLMEQDMTKYENQLASLRLEVKRLRNYDWYAKDLPQSELNLELLELQMKMETMTCERTALESAVLSRSLILERQERAIDLFTRMIRAKSDLSEVVNSTKALSKENTAFNPVEVSKSLSVLCTHAANNLTSLRMEREQIRDLEQIVMTQSAQLERYAEVRIFLENRRTELEREMLRLKGESVREGGVSYHLSDRRCAKPNYLE